VMKLMAVCRLRPAEIDNRWIRRYDKRNGPET